MSYQNGKLTKAVAYTRQYQESWLKNEIDGMSEMKIEHDRTKL